MHPAIIDNSPPLDHTLIIEASVSVSIANQTEIEDENEKGGGKKKRKRKRMQRRKASAAFHDTVITQLGDDDIRLTEFAANGAKIEPTLRIYPGSHHMSYVHNE
eukprot:scaffold45324_cov168-Skeletonema_marinoi.AAC.4